MRVQGVKVKICGLTQALDIESAVAAGADAVGVVFARSPRQVTAKQAVDLLSCVPDGVLRVGLFMGQSAAEVGEVVRQVSLDLLQFHGAAEADFCAGFGLPYLKAIAVDSGRAVREAKRYPDAFGILFDAPAPGGAGGTGRTFDWSLLASIPQPVWLAGGLEPGNVAEAVAAVGPDWVDVSSGVEDRPGIKNADKMRRFVAAARAAAEPGVR